MGTSASAHKKGISEVDLDQGSDEIREETTSVRYCNPCNNAGEQNEAVGFCVDCDECLCSICFRSHSRNRLSKLHVLLSHDAIPGQAVKLCDPCKSVKEENEAEGFCSNCKEYLCFECFQAHARSKLSKHHIVYSKHSLPQPLKQGEESIKENCSYNEEYQLVNELDVKCRPEEEDCFITGITLVSDNVLVLTDETNRKLMLIDLKEHYQKWLKMKSVPNRITSISYDQVAVVLRSKCEITVISIPELDTIRSLKTDGDCVDIECINTKLYVSFRQPLKFQILDLTGKIKSTIIPDGQIVASCTAPGRIAVSQDETLIFISDFKRKSLMSMDMSGNMISLYPTPLPYPSEIIISPFGLIYVCIRGKHMIYKMTTDFKDVTVIVGANDGIPYPLAGSLDVSKKRLYVSSGSDLSAHRNCIKVFEWR